MKKIIAYGTACFCLIQLFSCKKYLDASSSSKLAVPTTLEDLQALMDDNWTMNLSYPAILDVLSDDIYLTTQAWQSLPDGERSIYLWQKTGLLSEVYSSPYAAIYKSNLVLEELDHLTIDQSQALQYNRIKGSALFFRAAYLYGLAQLYAFPYYSRSASADPGVPLRLGTDFSAPVVRATVGQTYRQIIGDLRAAAAILPGVADLKTRPSVEAAYGWLARTYLQMHQYDSAGYYADLCLSRYDGLLNFSSDIDPGGFAPFQRFNKEVIFHMASQSSSALYPGIAKIDSNLYILYAPGDLRKTAFFYENFGPDAGTFSFKGDYDGAGSGSYVFSGITTSEQYLIRAESFARAGNVEAALHDLNTLLTARYDPALLTPVTAASADEVLTIILQERRKELLFRGLRWSDLRRLNDDPRFAITLTRNINNQLYSLDPLSNGYLLWFPNDVIRLSEIEQNP